MIELTLPKYQKARIWLGELPKIDYDAIEVLEQTIRLSCAQPAAGYAVAVELSGRPGPSSYGLLGAEYVPHNGESLLLRVPVSIDKGETIDWALAGICDIVHAGLLQEFAQYVFPLAATILSAGSLGTGVITFYPAAWGEAGSSQFFSNG